MSKTKERNDAIKVAIRQRLLNDSDYGQDIIEGYESKSEDIIIVDGRPYCFDHVLEPTISQKKLYEKLLQPLVENVKKGYNCTALAYGQTGTGKSYTMGLTSQMDDEAHAGVVSRCMWDLLQVVEEYEIKVSFVEIYNEKVFDLLAAVSSEPIMAKGLKYASGVWNKIVNIEECNKILMQAITKRHVRPTLMNKQSSRSHVIFTIEVTSKVNGSATRAHLNLVDLAGSEGVRRTGHKGIALIEGVHINQSLLCISNILQAMSERHKIIPYRDSVLGFVLQDSLSSNSYLTLLACISAKNVDLSETLSTIRFAQRAKQTKRSPQMNFILNAILKNQKKTRHQWRTFMENNKDNKIKSGRGKGMQSKLEFISDISERITPEKHRTLRSKEISPLNAQSESLLEYSMESWKLNVFSSTNLEAKSSNRGPLATCSSNIQKCSEKFETLLERKLQALLASISSSNPFSETAKLLASPNTNETRRGPVMSSAVRSKIKDIMREIIFESRNLRASSPCLRDPKITRKWKNPSSNAFNMPNEKIVEEFSPENSVREQTELVTASGKFPFNRQ